MKKFILFLFTVSYSLSFQAYGYDQTSCEEVIDFIYDRGEHLKLQFIPYAAIEKYKSHGLPWEELLDLDGKPFGEATFKVINSRKFSMDMKFYVDQTSSSLNSIEFSLEEKSGQCFFVDVYNTFYNRSEADFSVIIKYNGIIFNPENSQLNNQSQIWL